jgi:hypothetical protein
MNFLNPLALFALAAIAVPILIHIFSRRRVPEVPFSTIRFLRRSDRRSMVRINLRRLVLLALRVLAIAAIALAFARPVVRGSLAALFPPGGSRAACILIDRSYSMGVEGEGGTAFERAKARVLSIIDNLDRGDETAIIAFDSSAETVYDGELDPEAARAAVRELRPSWAGTDLRRAAALALERLGATRRVARELYIVSDFQRTGLSVPGAGEGAPSKRALPVRAFLVPVRTEGAANVAIEEALAPRVTVHRGETASLAILLKNTSPDVAARFPLEVSVGARRILEKEIEIAPGNEARETVSFPAERSGWTRGVVSKRSDRLPADDARYFALDVREKARVLLVTDGGSFYLEQALSPEGSEGDIAVTTRPWRAFTTADLDSSETVVLGPGRGPTGADVDVIDRFVSRGGRAIVLLTPGLEEAAARLSRYALRVDDTTMPRGYFGIAKPESPPPFLAPFSDEDLEALERLKFRSAPLVTGVPAGAAALAFTTGNPFVWEEARGAGTVVFAAFDPRPEAGELVLSPSFLPLVQQLVLATGTKRSAAEGSLVGRPVTWSLPAGAAAVCELPDGSAVKPERTASGIVVPAVETPGFVTIVADGETTGTIAVNPDCRAESELSALRASEAADSLGLGPRLVIGEGQGIALAIRTGREGKEIAGALLLAAMALLVAELAAAQRAEGEPA